MTALGKKYPLPIIPSVNPLEDSTQLDTIFFTAADKVRFQKGKLRKIRGWQRVFSNNFERIIGAARNIFSCRDANSDPVTIIGTNRSLYVLEQGTFFYNITPLQTTTHSIPNAFTTEYNSLVTVTATTTVGSPVVTLNLTQFLNNGDQIQISGVTGGPYNGIPASAFNQTFNAEVINNSQIQINVGVPALSFGTVNIMMTWATSYLYVYDPGFTGLKGDRIKIELATGVANIPAGQINGEDVVTNVTTGSTFIIQTETIANALVTAGGGAATTIQYQILAGQIDQSIGFGYGGGQYGAGEYGTSKAFTNESANTAPRIWSMDKFVNVSGATYIPYIVLTPGDSVGYADGTGANVYSWNFNILTAPVLIANAPYFVQWLYVSHNAICTLGGALATSSPTQGIPNFFASSDQDDMTNWTPSPSSFASFFTFDNAGALISQASTRDVDLVFTEDEVYRIVYVDKPQIWQTFKLLTTDGIMAPKARTEIEDAVFWMGKGDFFVFNDTSLNVLPNNTIKRYVYDNVNDAQSDKCFAYANTLYNEVWFFYVAGQDMEPNNYVMYNYVENTWVTGTLPRTASEEPLNISTLPYLIQSQIINTIAPVSISSYFFALGNNPFLTQSGTRNITFDLMSNLYLQVGDYIQVSGSTAINGIPAGEINGIKQIVGIVTAFEGGYGEGEYGAGEYGTNNIFESQIEIQSTSTNASSSSFGGGSAITIGTSVLGVDVGPNGTRISTNEEVTITGVGVSIGGIPSPYINVTNDPIRAIVGSVIQINDSAPATIFSTSQQTVNNPGNWELNYIPSDRLFQHEAGLNDYNTNYIPSVPGSDPRAPMLSYFTTNMAQVVGDGAGDDTMVIYSLYPDTSQAGNLTLTVNGRLYPQSPIINPSLGGTNGVYTLTPQTTKIDMMFVARERQYSVESFVIDGDFLIGRWFEELRPSSTR